MADFMMNRRTLLQSSAWLILAYPMRRVSAFQATPQFVCDPFSAGVASGDPTSHSIVLWTRLVPDANRTQEWQRESVAVEWQISSDESMSHIVRSGRVFAQPEYGHSVHVNVDGLQAGRWYWYRFKAGSAISEIGRTKTAPGGPADRIRFAFASCQNFQHGYYTAYQNLLKEDIDLVIFLGDYIYETGGNAVRSVPLTECTTLDQYRDRYALYRSDHNLREAHRLFPWVITWDDHEVDDNYANGIASDGEPRADFLKRRAAAYRAHYEWLPLPKACSPIGANSNLYRTLSFGPLANFLVLDGRQYRSDQPCGDGIKEPCEEFSRDNRTMLGTAQEKWLSGRLRASHSQWNIIANQVRMTVVDQQPGPGERYAMDQWTGYEGARRRLVGQLLDNKVSNPVVITGDIHSNWVGDVKLDYREQRSPVVATELIGTSISSGGDGTDSDPAVEAYLAENPQIKLYNSQRGYVRCEITRNYLKADFRVVAKVSVPESQISTRATFITENSKPGAVRA
jgi:alkaline phosphatase D